VLFAEANPTIVSYNASAVKNYNAASSLVRFENIFFLKKRTSLLHGGVVNVNSEVVGLAPGLDLA
jgi:hypothetical protein